jgi:hypothetical protein
MYLERGTWLHFAAGEQNMKGAQSFNLARGFKRCRVDCFCAFLLFTNPSVLLPSSFFSVRHAL